MNAGDKIVKVMIGRFQPFHDGHLKCLRAAIDTSDRVIVVIGSAQYGQRSFRNPWGFLERRAMIAGALTPAERLKVSILAQADRPGADKEWVKEVKAKVRGEARGYLPRGKIHYTLVGCHKGADTYYLALYKGWSLDLMPVSEALNATDIRNLYFDETYVPDKSGLIYDWGEHLPGSSYGFLLAWRIAHPEEFKRLIHLKKENT